MNQTELSALLKANETVERQGIFIAKGIADRTVWDKLAVENPTHAVISANDEESAKKKSENQIADVKSHLKETDVILDFGSGYGRMAQYLLPQMTLAGYIAVDSSHEMLSLFRERYIRSDVEQKTPLLLINADIHTVPLKDNSVDMVEVCAVFLHNHKDVVTKSLTEIERVLKPGGTLLVYSSFPRVMTAMGLQGMAYQILLNLLGKPFKNGPVRYYSRAEVIKLLSRFASVEVKPFGFAVLPKGLIFLPRLLKKLYRVYISKPTNKFLAKIMPDSWKPRFAVYYNVVAKR